MTEVSQTRDTFNFLVKPLYALGGTALFIAFLALIRVLVSWQGETQLSWLALTIPWLAIGIASVSATRVKPALQMALTAGAITLAAFLSLQEFVWHLSWVDRWGFALRDTGRLADSVILSLTLFLEALALIVLMVATVWVLLALRPLLLGPASRASFGIDTTLLIAAFSLLALNGFNDLDSGLMFGAFNQILTLAWIVPSVIVLALFVRQGGALAVGSTVGLLAGTAILPWITSVIETFAGEYSGLILSRLISRPEYYISAPLGLLLIVSIWWALSRNAGGNPDNVTATSNSPINSTSIVAFCLAWIPFTSIPALVLGHMSYDQIVDGDKPQRGLGLARWSIVFAYLSLFGGGFLIFNQLT